MFSKLKYLLYLITYCCAGQGNHFPEGAISQSLGGANITSENAFSIRNNIAGIAGNSFIIAATYQNRFNLSSLNSTLLLILVPLKKLNFGIQFSKFGNNYLNE